MILHDHAKFSHSHAKRSRKTKMKLIYFPLYTIMRNCWGSCENVFSLDSLLKKPSKDLLNDAKCLLDLGLWIEMWLTHLRTFWIFPNCRTFQTSSLYIILYFPSFSLIFSVAKHVLWDQISKHERLNLIFLGGGRI